MSLLRKASIVTTPTSYENGKILSVKPVQSLGVELVTNGNFESNVNGWGTDSGATLTWQSDQTALVTSTADSTFAIVQGNVLTVNRKYKVSLKFKPNNTGLFRVRLGGNSVTFSTSVFNVNEWNNIEFIGVADNTILEIGSSGGSITNFYIDNVSVKELTDADFDFTRNSSATRVNSQGLIEDMQILSGDLVSNGDFSQIGSELVTNGDFATDSDWVKSPSGLTISGGSANFTSGQDTYVFQDIMTIGKQYFIELEYNITSLTGVAYFGSNGGSGNAIISMTGLSGSGTLSGYITASATKLIIRSSTFDGSIDNVSVKEVFLDWTVQGDNITIVEGAARINRITNTTFIQQNVLTSGKTYLVEFDVLNKPDNNGTFIVRLGSNNVYDVVTYEGTRFSKYITSAGSDFRIYSSSNNGVIYVDNVSLIEITEDTNLPRIDYTGGVGHWLFEPQRTNSLLQSNQFNESEWSKTNTSVSANETGVGGSTDAWLLSKNSSNALIRQFITTTGANSFSVYVKKGSLSWVRLFIASSTESSSVYVNLDNGLTGTSSGSPTVKVIPMDNGWYRCIITKDTTNINNFRIYPADADNDISGTSGNIYIQYAQLEQSSFATSYIPTSGSTVTRLKDAAFGAGSTDLINSTEGVLYAEVAALANDGTFRLLSLSDGTSSNRVYLGYNNNDNTITANVTSGGVSQGIISYTTTDLSLFHKVAVKYKNNDVSLYVNGIEVGVDTSATTPSGLNALQFTSGSISSVFFGKTKCVAVFKEALTDAELTCLTTI